VGDEAKKLGVLPEFSGLQQVTDPPEGRRRQGHRPRVAQQRRAARRIADQVELIDHRVGLVGVDQQMLPQRELEGLRIAVRAQRPQPLRQRRPQRRPELDPRPLVRQRQQRLRRGPPHRLRVLLLGVHRPEG
jgi:hypothetical protein